MIKKNIIIIVLFSLVGIYILATQPYNVVIKTDTHKEIVFGIIDEGTSQNYDNVIVNKEEDSESLTHGDMMILFANECNSNNKIYYYDASSDGTISTENIIKGLEWMVQNSVTKVNLSLSSKIYSDELENWIEKHKDIIKVYASYNNEVNSYDYPAMYGSVVSSGKKSFIEFKENDFCYNSSKILIISRIKIKYYEGNSCLSMLTIIKSCL